MCSHWSSSNGTLHAPRVNTNTDFIKDSRHWYDTYQLIILLTLPFSAFLKFVLSFSSTSFFSLSYFFFFLLFCFFCFPSVFFRSLAQIKEVVNQEVWLSKLARGRRHNEKRRQVETGRMGRGGVSLGHQGYVVFKH